MVQDDGSSSSVTSLSPLQMFSLMSLSPGIGSSPRRWLREMPSEERGLCLIQLLVACANHVAAGSVDSANVGLDCIARLASPDGDTMQRIAAYFTEALADRMLKAWPGIHRALNSTRIDSAAEELLARRLFFNFCPFLKLSYVITNQAILEAMEGEKVVHIIDLDLFDPSQWISLLQDLRARPEGPPHLRITGVHQRKEVLDHVARLLNDEAERLDVPFQFNSIVCRQLEDLNVGRLPVKMGEAVAVSSVLQLHALLAVDDDAARRNSPNITKGLDAGELMQGASLMNPPHTLGEFLDKDMISPDSVSLSTLSPRMANFLNGLWGLSPKIVVVTEPESNHNGANLMDRVMEALNFYAALFDCLESTVVRASAERLRIEKAMFGEEIKNIVACEGVDRKRRHERLERWILRLEMAGFGRVALSYHVMMQARRLLQSYGYEGYKIKEENGCFMICWQDQPLYAVSAWRFRR